MEYETENGTETLLDEPIIAWVESFAQVVSLPQDAWERFRDITQATFDPELQMLTMPPDGPPLGNLTVTLSNGFQSTIPSHELFWPQRTISDDGRLEIANPEDTLSAIVNITSFDREIGAIWGYPFLAQVYMVVDHAREEFKIGKARTTIDATRESILDGALIQTNIQTICASNDDSSSGSGTNAGAIAGGVVGGVAGLALILVGIWFFLRRRKAKAAATSSGSSSGEPPKKTPAEMEDQSPPAYQPAAGGAAKDAGSTGQSPPTVVEMSPNDDPRFSMSEMQSPEQANGGGFVAQQTKPLELEASVPEGHAAGEKKGGPKDLVELP